MLWDLAGCSLRWPEDLEEPSLCKLASRPSLLAPDCLEGTVGEDSPSKSTVACTTFTPAFVSLTVSFRRPDFFFLFLLPVLFVFVAIAACDVTRGVASLNFDATELQIFQGNLGSPSNPNLQYGHFETYPLIS